MKNKVYKFIRVDKMYHAMLVELKDKHMGAPIERLAEKAIEEFHAKEMNGGKDGKNVS